MFVVSSQKCPVEVQHIQRISIRVSAVTRLTPAVPVMCAHPAPEGFVESRKRRRGAHQADAERKNRAQDPAAQKITVVIQAFYFAYMDFLPEMTAECIKSPFNPIAASFLLFFTDKSVYGGLKNVR
ncbi:hypothetical protein ROHU_020430 [Labeo rohita]|uniref:Uncharacterized protein n=1 Tax=Labeo rohita TaxID=84645 RepID=A0A498NCW5_LABRO|nr:hypothetical protein ROHU_020430 [Labeo rohita]